MDNNGLMTSASNERCRSGDIFVRGEFSFTSNDLMDVGCQ